MDLPPNPVGHGCPQCCADCTAGKCHKHCGALNRRGHLCANSAGKGTDHRGIGACRFHGGSTRSHERAANHERARQQVAVYGLAVDVEPEVALVDECRRTAGHVTWLGSKLAGLESDDDLLEDGKPSPWVALYQAERSHLARVAKACLDAGVAERQVKIAEAQGAMLADVIDQVIGGMAGALVEAGVELSVVAKVQRDEVPSIVRRCLTPLADAG